MTCVSCVPALLCPDCFIPVSCCVSGAGCWNCLCGKCSGMRNKKQRNWSRVVTVTGWKGNNLVPLFPETSIYIYVHNAPSLCIIQHIKHRPPNLCTIKSKGVVAKIWWALERGVGNCCRAPPQIVKVFLWTSSLSLYYGLKGGCFAQDLVCAACGCLLTSVGSL